MHTFPLLLLLCFVFPLVSSRTLPEKIHREPKNNLTLEDKEVHDLNLPGQKPHKVNVRQPISPQNVGYLYEDFDKKENVADFEDILNGSFRRSGRNIGRFLYISLPTAICFLASVIGLCLLSRPGTHFTDCFTRPHHALCQHQQKTVDAVRRRYESSDKRHSKYQERMVREEREEKKDMEKERRQKDKRAVEKEKTRKARKKAAEKARAKQMKEREKLRMRRERDMRMRERQRAHIERQQQELMRRRERTQGQGQFPQNKTMRQREYRGDKSTKDRTSDDHRAKPLPRESRSLLEMAGSLSRHRPQSTSRIRIRDPPGEARRRR